ncbi:MAG: NAD(P)-binding protein [Nanoarchaeota archaeon]
MYVERKGKKVDTQRTKKTKPYDIILFGYNKMGYDLLDSFKKLKKKYLIVDYDPETILALKKEGYACEYGDAEDLELLEELNIGKAQMIISTISSVRINNTLLAKARELNKKAVVIVVSHHIEEAIQLYKAGATYVVMPHMVGGSHTSNMIKKYGVDVTKFFQERTEHINVLRHRAKQHNIRKIKDMYSERTKYFKGNFK